MRVPTFAYPGGKARLASRLVAMMPPSGNTYVEPFAGRGNVLFNAIAKLNYTSWRVNDLQTAPFFHALQSLDPTYQVPERSLDLYWKVRGTHPCPESYLLEPYLCFSGANFGRGGYKGDGKGGVSRATFQWYVHRAHDLLQRVEVSGDDYREVLRDLGEDDFAYLDPPYCGTDTRAYDSDTLNHLELVDILQAAKFKWMLSEYSQPMYTEAFGEPSFVRDVQLLCTNTGSGLRKRRRECVWTNY